MGTRDKLEGKGKEAMGGAREKAGEWTDDPELESEGKAQKWEGKGQGFAGDVKDKAEDVKDKFD
jgi:uncharacterized protein YjbJ (UPF0337 family)